MTSSQPTKPRFNFTLRESLLGMVAVASLLALGVKSYEQTRPFAPTPLYARLDNTKVKAIVSSAGESLGVDANLIGTSAGSSSDGNSATSEIRLRVGTPIENPSPIVVALRREIQQLLSQDEIAVISSGTGTEGDKTNVTQFWFDYEKENTRGHMFVQRIPNTSNMLQLFILIHEFKK